jgi:hypothetical protein
MNRETKMQLNLVQQENNYLKSEMQLTLFNIDVIRLQLEQINKLIEDLDQSLSNTKIFLSEFEQDDTLLPPTPFFYNFNDVRHSLANLKQPIENIREEMTRNRNIQESLNRTKEEMQRAIHTIKEFHRRFTNNFQ